MKKLFPLALVAAFAIPLCAEPAAPETETDELALDDDNSLAVQVDAPRKNSAMWPAFVGVWEFPETPDLVGVRFTIPWSTKQENITGFDIGFWGRSEYFEGVQFNVLRNDVKDVCSGVQCGVYNSVATSSGSRSASGTSRSHTAASRSASSTSPATRRASSSASSTAARRCTASRWASSTSSATRRSSSARSSTSGSDTR